jgi:hypothetical protein
MFIGPRAIKGVRIYTVAKIFWNGIKILNKNHTIICKSIAYPNCTVVDCVPELEIYLELKFNQEFY